MVSTSSLRTVTLSPKACDISVSAALAPPSFAAFRTRAASAASADEGRGNRVAGETAAAVAVIDGLCKRSRRAPSIIANALLLLRPAMRRADETPPAGAPVA